MKIKIIALLLITSSAFCQNAGKSGLSFLKLGCGARNVAMGNTGTVASDDATALNYNPAILGKLNTTDIFFTHNEWIQEVRSEFLGASFNFIGIPLALGINTASVSDIEVRLQPGEAISKFNANYFNISASTGFGIFENIFVGASVKYLYEGMLQDESEGYGVDLGLYYDSPVKNLCFAAALKNLGSMNKLKDESTKLPTDVTAGAKYSYHENYLKSDITIASEYQYYTASLDNHLNLGVEILYDNLIAFRGGYQTGYESKNVSAGIGLKYKGINFDYAFVPFTDALGTAHQISIKYRL
jgi:hypothetical protein